jgi:hypothetical protein
MPPKLKMELGAEPKKVIFLGALLALAGYLIFTNLFSEPERPEGSQAKQGTPAAGKSVLSRQAQQAQDALIAAGPKVPQTKRTAAGRSEFKPTLKPREAPDPMTIDPSLRVDLLDKLARATVSGSQRSLFEFGAMPRPEDAIKKQPEPKIVVKRRMIGPEPPPPPPPPPPPVVKPPPPPITLKFYGSMMPRRAGVKRVFCMDGDEIHVPAEGDVIRKRYRIVRINASTVVVEDIDHKNQQTLKIEEPPKTG